MVDNDKIDELLGVEAEVVEELVLPESAAPGSEGPDGEEAGEDDEAGDRDDAASDGEGEE